VNDSTPDEIGLEYQNVWFEAQDGVKLHGWFLPHENAKASLLFCHGNAGNIGWRLESLRQFHSLEINVFIFDYRGYGKSEGWLSEKGTYLDGQAAYDWLKQKTPDKPLILFGRSMGTAIATDIAVHNPAAALIFESGFTSITDMGKELFPFLPVSLINSIQYNSLSKIADIDMPILVIHSKEDDIVPFHQGKAIYEKAQQPKEFYTMNGTHNEGHFDSEEPYLKRLGQFIEGYVAGTPEPQRL
jgi:hypothetical protein